MRQESVFTPTIWPTVQGLAAGAVMTVLGVGIVANGFGLVAAGGLVFMIFGAAMALGGPLVIFVSLTGKRGGYGPCPVCLVPMKADFGDATNLLCVGCGTYVDVKGDRLVPADLNKVSEEARFGFATPTPWKDIRNGTFDTINLATSAQDFAQDKLQELLMKDHGTRVLDARWPTGCCVCGKPATRTMPFAKRVTFVAKTFDEKATLLAPAVPYCKDHSDGIDFDRVSFASRGDHHSFGIRFRSLAYREAFRKLNPWPWAGVAPPKPPPTAVG